MAKPNVAILGTGLMGGKMAERLASQGFNVSCWNRTLDKIAHLSGKSPHINVSRSASEAVQQSQVILIMLADGAAIRSVLLEDAAVKALLQNKTILMMSTIGPEESKQLAASIQGCGAEYIECPVLGSIPEVENGTLQVLVGSADHPENSPGWHVLCAFTSVPRHIGPIGSASSLKLALNQLIVTETLAFSASLGFVRRNGGDSAASVFMDVLRANGNYYAPTFDRKLSKYMSREFRTANFPTKHLLKDARLFCQEAEGLGMDTRMQRAAEKLVESACQMPGLAEADYSSVYEAVVHPAKQSCM